MKSITVYPCHETLCMYKKNEESFYVLWCVGNRGLLIRKNGAVESAAFCIKNKNSIYSYFICILKKRMYFLKSTEKYLSKEDGYKFEEERQEWNESLHSDP